jgi:hypothetical protein
MCLSASRPLVEKCVEARPVADGGVAELSQVGRGSPMVMRVALPSALVVAVDPYW